MLTLLHAGHLHTHEIAAFALLAAIGALSIWWQRRNMR